MEIRPLPPAWRLILGFILGPAVAALIFATASPLYAGLTSFLDRVLGTFVAACWVVYPITAVLGLPLYLALRNRAKPSVFNLALAGAAVSMAPWLLLLLVTPDEASTGNVVTVHNHIRTIAGWLEILPFMGEIALLGATAGLVFWCCVTLGRQSTPRTA